MLHGLLTCCFLPLHSAWTFLMISVSTDSWKCSPAVYQLPFAQRSKFLAHTRHFWNQSNDILQVFAVFFTFTAGHFWREKEQKYYFKTLILWSILTLAPNKKFHKQKLAFFLKKITSPRLRHIRYRKKREDILKTSALSQ